MSYDSTGTGPSQPVTAEIAAQNGHAVPLKKAVFISHANGLPDFEPITLEDARLRCQCGNTKCKCHRSGGLVHCPAHSDPNPSLSLTESHGKVLWHCHAHCSQEAVTAALTALKGQSAPQVYNVTPNGKPKPEKGTAKREIHYKYHDADGKTVMRVTRREYADGTKDFIQERPDGHGFAPGVKGVEPVLYGLPAIETAEIVVLVEGEKNADDLNAALELSGHYWTIVATTNAGGAGKFYEAHATQLSGRRVVVIPDNDAPGEKHLSVVAPLAFMHASRVQVLRLPGLASKGDVSDWLAAGGTSERLLELMQSAPDWTPTADGKGLEVAPFEFSFGGSLLSNLGEIKWLWPGFIPVGFVTALVGDQDMGKSSVAQGFCDTVLRGTHWPDGQRCEGAHGSRLLWIDTEGAIALWAARCRDWGMDADRFVFPKDGLRELRIDDPADWLWIETAIEMFKPPVVVIDALSGAHRGKENDSGDMKNLMKRLGELAQRHQIAVVAVHHLSKPVTGVPEYPITLHRMRGSSAISQFCRSVLAVGTPDASQPERRRLDVIKLNLAPKPEPVGYRLTGIGPAWGDAPEMPRANRSVDDATDLLKMAFADTDLLPSDEIFAAAKAKGIGDTAMKNAKKSLGIQAIREGGKDGKWFWKMDKF